MSPAFVKLKHLAHGMNIKMGGRNHRAIAIYIGRLYQTRNHPTMWPSIDCSLYEMQREQAIDAVVQLTDNEWRKIRDAILSYGYMITSDKYVAFLNEWVIDLETIRAFG